MLAHKVEKTAHHWGLTTARREHGMHHARPGRPAGQDGHQQLRLLLSLADGLGHKADARAREDGQLERLQVVGHITRLVLKHIFLTLGADQQPGASSVSR